MREYSNTKLNEIETTPYQEVQTLHEYTMPENWFEYQTIVSWDTNNYMKPMSEKRHHEIEKHIRVPDRNLLFTPETSIDFSLKMKIQEYKNRILWQGDVKEGLPSPVIFQRTDNVTVDILTETLLPETLFDVSYNIEEHIHEQIVPWVELLSPLLSPTTPSLLLLGHISLLSPLRLLIQS